jgi:hypothetical protein
MNDSDLGAAVRESVAGIRSATPVDQIIAHGRGIRARRRIPQAATAALTVAAGAALAVTALQPSGHAGNQPGSVQLAAWTVTRQANGDIEITVNQLMDPNGLQATLRADGLPATVSFDGPPLSAACQQYPASRDELSAVAQFQGTGGITIDPSALPSGTGVLIYDRPGTGFPSKPIPARAPSGSTPLEHPQGANPLKPTSATGGPLAVGLVYASQQCTG